MRDMLDNDTTYPLKAWRSQFDRLRLDLDDALERQGRRCAERPERTKTPEQRDYLTSSLAQFWDAVGRIFDLAESGRESEARTPDPVVASGPAGRAQLRRSRGSSSRTTRPKRPPPPRCRTSTGRCSGRCTGSWPPPSRAIVATSLYLIHSNRRLFAHLASLFDERRHLAQTLIATRESTLREIARELHDDIGQLLTAIGLMIRRAANHAPDDSPVREDLREMGEVAQTALDNVRGFSQTLHPSILDELGLESTIDWYLSTVERQLGLRVTYERAGQAPPIDATIAIHVYRVLQEALSNVARHSGASEAVVRLRFVTGQLQLEVEDRGVGHVAPASGSPRGLGLVTMRERAALVGGDVTLLQSPNGGTLVRLTVPV